MQIALLLLPDFLLIALGAALKRAPAFAPGFWPGLERLVYFVLFPVLLFRSLAEAELSLRASAPLLEVGIAYTVLGMVLSALAGWLFAVPRPVFKACFQCGFRFNTYVVLGITSRVAGEPGVALVSLLVGVLVPIVNVAAVAMLVHDRRALLRQVVQNPLVLACVAGIAWNASGLGLWEPVRHVLALLAGAALPLGLLAVGAGLAFARGHLGAGPLAYWTVLKLVVLPGAAWWLAGAVGLGPLETTAAVLLAAVPTAPSAYILAMQMTGVGAPVALLISTGTLAAAVTIPLWIAVIGR